MKMLLRLKEASARAWRFTVRRGLLPLVVITAACLVIEEQYPFSHFPMYSSFSSKTDYVYLADGADRPLPSFLTIGLSTATLKKMFQSEVRIERRRRPKTPEAVAESRRAAANTLLSRFRAADAAGTIADLPEVLRLYEVEIRLADSQITKEATLVGESR